MTDARREILGTLRSALNRNQRPPNAARRRLTEHPVNLVPGRGQADPETQVGLFSNEAIRVEATISRIDDMAGVPGAVSKYLVENNLPAEIRVSPSLQGVPWTGQPMLNLTDGIAQGSDSASISRAFGGVAETGTLVFLSGPENPTTLNFVPPIHIAVIATTDIDGDYEAVWARLRAQFGPESADFMPRTVNWITGPSRTADIEQTLLLGAHGPQQLHIIIVDDPET